MFMCENSKNGRPLSSGGIEVSRRKLLQNTILAGSAFALSTPGSHALAESASPDHGQLNPAAETELDSIGQLIEARIQAEVEAVSIERYAELLELTNLNGESTGYCKVFKGDKLAKGSMFSMSIPPVGRYFNIHLIPDARYRIPRFSYEGMLTSRGSQCSIDLYPDKDVVMDLVDFEDQYRGVAKIYAQAQKNELIEWQPAEQAFLRAIFSPFALLSFTIPGAGLGAMEGYADGYFSEWLKMYAAGQENSDAETAYVTERRARMKEVMRARDPNVEGVIAIYGEEKTRAIQDATLL
jgi:hypothetical protein